MKNWHCIYTKHNMEESVCNQLMTLPNIEVFNPKLKHGAFRRGIFREVVEHLFPCYIFSKFIPTQYYRLITYTRGVKYIISDQSGHPCIVEERIINQIQSRLKQDGYIHVEPPSYKPGDKMIIQEGPLAGFTGIFQEAKARERVLILLNAINYQARIEVDKRLLLKL